MKASIVLIFGALLLPGCSNMNQAQTKETAAPIAKIDTRTCDVKNEYQLGSDFDRFDAMAQQLAHASGCFIQTNLANTGDVKVNPVKGKMSIREAIKTAIAGTRLHVIHETAKTITIN